MMISKNKEYKLKKIKTLEIYLMNGMYQFDRELCVFFLTSNKDSPILVSCETDKNEHVTINSKIEKKFRGEILWFCSNGDIRVFSDSKTLTLCKNKKNYMTKIDNYDYFSQHFNLPKLTFREDKNYALIEEFVHFKPNKHSDTHFILKEVYSDYMNYFKYMTQIDNYPSYSLNDLTQSNPKPNSVRQVKVLRDAIDDRLFNEKFPFIKLHGDLWTGNILLTNTETPNLVYIDWDESGNYIFFYDFFKFMWNELDVNGRYDIYQLYMDGRFDSYLDSIFSLFQLPFDPLFKKDYFCMFMLNYVLRYSDTIPDEIKQQEISDFIKKVF